MELLLNEKFIFVESSTSFNITTHEKWEKPSSEKQQVIPDKILAALIQKRTANDLSSLYLNWWRNSVHVIEVKEKFICTCCVITAI
mmetsp:Transcript_16376/g.27989  ORF Transcript_16376/g.27989 Transcript_16376/m.27989 type:complete len:86 (+) Transcript_16376:117-374(+)